MSSISSQASAASASDSKEPGCEPSRSANRTCSAGSYSKSIGRTCPAIPMCDCSPETDCARTASNRTSSAADFPAKTFPRAARKPAWREPDLVSGMSSPDFLASYAPDLRLWRTSQTSLVEELATFFQTWPRSGTTRSGIAYQLPSLACRRPGSAFGLLPTLTAGDAKGARNGTAKGRSSAWGLTMTDWLWLNVEHGMLEPGSAEQLMGYPIGFTELEPSATPSSRKSRKSSGGRS